MKAEVKNGQCKTCGGKMIVNIFWREAGWPGLPMSETWQTRECDARDWAATAREMIQTLRRSVAGLYRVRVAKAPIAALASSSAASRRHTPKAPEKEAA